MNNKRTIVWTIVGALTLVILLLAVTGVGAEPSQITLAAPSAPLAVFSDTITFQGRLLDNVGNPVDGSPIMTFTLYTQAEGSAPVWEDAYNVPVANGLFNADLAVPSSLFDGQALWLGVQVEGDAQEMQPRQQLLPAPYAFYAKSAPWDGITNVPPELADGDQDTQYSDGTGLSLAGTQFFIALPYRLPQTCSDGEIPEWNDMSGEWGCGSDDVGGGAAAWLLGGNAGTTPGADVLGTTDPASLTLVVDTVPALRLEPGAVPNLVGGDRANWVSAGITGAVIGGGGSGGDPHWVGGNYGTIGGGVGNVASNSNTTVGGGASNTAGGPDATIGGGFENAASGYRSTIGGGNNNIASGSGATIAGGSYITATVDYASVGGGRYNVVTATHGTIGGGELNTASGDYTTVGGGYWNRATGSWAATVGGGLGNVASGSWAATIAGGEDNLASGQSSAVGGGVYNYAIGDFATIGGGSSNAASYAYATIGGGYSNIASGQDATIGGGSGNVASGNDATIAGGWGNTASYWHATVGGGYSNTAGGNKSTIGGGEYINATGYAATVAGGSYITATADYAAVGGGWRNVVTATNATVGGGRVNTASSYAATVGGGDSNTASGSYAATVAGGNGNTASGDVATVGGGQQNDAIGAVATIAGGRCNKVDGIFGTIAGGGVSGDPSCAYGNNVTDNGGTIGGGGDNQAGDGSTDTGNATYATVGGGYTNVASGSYATIPGGQNNTAQGDFSFAAGYRAKANHLGSFVWSDPRSATDFTSQHNYQFRARAYGGFRFEDGENLWVEMAYLPSTPISTSVGAYLSGGGVWTSSSDRNLKENFEPVDSQDVLDRLAELPISTWNYKAEDLGVRHMGPVAQDFYAVFRLGDDDRHIAAMDTSGIALAAIQGLHTKNQALEAKVSALKTENATLKKDLNDLEARVAALEQTGTSHSTPILTTWWPLAGLVILAGIVVARRGCREGER